MLRKTFVKTHAYRWFSESESNHFQLCKTRLSNSDRILKPLGDATRKDLWNRTCSKQILRCNERITHVHSINAWRRRCYRFSVKDWLFPILHIISWKSRSDSITTRNSDCSLNDLCQRARKRISAHIKNTDGQIQKRTTQNSQSKLIMNAETHSEHNHPVWYYFRLVPK